MDTIRSEIFAGTAHWTGAHGPGKWLSAGCYRLRRQLMNGRCCWVSHFDIPTSNYPKRNGKKTLGSSDLKEQRRISEKKRLAPVNGNRAKYRNAGRETTIATNMRAATRLTILSLVIPSSHRHFLCQLPLFVKFLTISSFARKEVVSLVFSRAISRSS